MKSFQTKVIMFFIKYFCAALVLDLGKYAAVSAQSTVGMKCVLKSGRGTCRIYEQCETVYNDIKPPEILCGYEDRLPVVCCPNSGKHWTLQKITLPVRNRPNDQHYAALLAQLQETQEDSYLGKKCVLKSGRGTCRFFEHCQRVYDNPNPPELMCGYEDSLPVVCCPNDETDVFQEKTTLPTRKRPAEEACLRYSQEEPILRRMGAPVVLEGRIVPEYLDHECHPPPLKLYIVGGIPAAPREFPHMAVIGYGPDELISWKCGGTLISEDFVLTAAHCLSSTSLGPAKWVRMGDLILNSTNDDARPQDRRISQIISHPDYTSKLNYHDIALLKLESPVIFDAYVRPACLSLEQHVPEEELVIATGWGLTEDDEDAVTYNLMRVELPVVPYVNCSNHYTFYKEKLPNGVDDNIQLCAGGSDGKDTCQGDSGGPLTTHRECMFDINGITSFGPSCGSSVPAIYTKVYAYVPWIESIVWPNLN